VRTFEGKTNEIRKIKITETSSDSRAWKRLVKNLPMESEDWKGSWKFK
jgi:hypothetical protein